MLKRLREKRAAAAAAAAEQEEDDTPVISTARARVVPREPAVSDEKLLQDLNPELNDPELDEISFTVNQIHGDLDSVEKIDEIRQREFKELQAVSRKLSGLVLEHHKEFVQELTRVSELQEELDLTRVICKNDRRHLGRADDGIKTGLQIASRMRKRSRFVGVIKILRGIATLQHANVKFQELLGQDDFESAIELWLECSQTAQEYHMFNCVADLAGELVESRTRIIDHLDTALQNLVRNFDLHAYIPLHSAYKQLGLGKDGLDKLSSFIMDQVTTCCRACVAQYSKTTAKGAAKTSLKGLCIMLKPMQVLPCFEEVCTELCKLMVVHSDIEEWHLENINKPARQQLHADDEAADAAGDHDDADGDDASSSDPAEAASPEQQQQQQQPSPRRPDRRDSVSRLQTRDYTIMKMEQSRKRLWETIQRVASTFLAAANFANHSLTDFVRFLQSVRRLSEIGCDFSKQASAPILDDGIKMKTLVYLTEVHRQTLHQLKNRLETEKWEAKPIARGFNIFNMAQFRFLRRRKNSQAPASGGSSLSREGSLTTLDEASSGASAERTMATLAAFRRKNSFFRAKSVDQTEPQSQPSSAPATPTATTSNGGFEAGLQRQSSATQLVQQQSQQQTYGSPSRPTSANSGPPPPHCTDTTLFVVEQFGQYLEMMDTLRSVSCEVFNLMTELHDYYLTSVFSFFGMDNNTYPISVLSSKARNTIRNIQARADASQPLEGSQPLHASAMSFLGAAALNEDVALESPSSLFALGARVTAIESLNFLVTVWRSLLNNLKRRIPDEKHLLIESFLKDSVETVPELRWFMYKNAAAKMLNYANVVAQMSTVRWDIKDIKSQHSAYVDQLIQECKILSGRIASLGESRVPQAAYTTLWSEVLLQINLALLDGFASAKKCTNEGRALMQLDFQQYLTKLGNITTVKPVTELVETYIKAFYLTESEIESWLQSNHKNYSTKQLTALMGVLPASSKKSKKDLVRVVEELKNG